MISLSLSSTDMEVSHSSLCGKELPWPSGLARSWSDGRRCSRNRSRAADDGDFATRSRTIKSGIISFSASEELQTRTAGVRISTNRSAADSGNDRHWSTGIEARQATSNETGSCIGGEGSGTLFNMSSIESSDGRNR